MPRTQEVFDYLAPETMAAAHPRWKAAAAEAGTAAGGFLVWPTLTASALVDSNPLQRHGDGVAAGGLRLAPRFVAEREGGVHATVLYGAAEARLYPARPDADQLDGRVGLLHDWAPRRDLIIRLQAEAAQAQDVLDSRAAVTGSERGRPFTIRTVGVSGAVQKTFDTLFVSLGGSTARLGFADGAVRTRAGTPALSDQTRTDVKLRVGARLGPMLFAFAEPAANWRVLDAAPQHSEGTQIVGGLGFDGRGPLAGELFGGVQRQDYTLRPRAIGEPVFGARLAWAPSPAYSVTLAGARSLEQAAVGTARQPLGTPIDLVRETVTLRLTPSRAWSGELALEHAALRYIGTGRQDDLLGLGAALDVPLRHDLDVVADLRLTRLQSSLALASYARAVATLGARYRY